MVNEADLAVYMRTMNDILSSLPLEKTHIRMNALKFGKIVKNYPLQSKTKTLTKSEIQKFSYQLVAIHKNWAQNGSREWKVKEVSGGRFTLLFVRAGADEQIKTILDVDEE